MKIKVNDKKREITVIDSSFSIKNTERLEPRIYKLFKMLVSRKDQVVTRQEIIRSIWNDYPSAQELLNQSISTLRRLIGDTDKENRIIQTIPKSGYILNTAGLDIEQNESKDKVNFVIDRNFVLGVLIIVLLIVFILFH